MSTTNQQTQTCAEGVSLQISIFCNINHLSREEIEDYFKYVPYDLVGISYEEYFLSRRGYQSSGVFDVFKHFGECIAQLLDGTIRPQGGLASIPAQVGSTLTDAFLTGVNLNHNFKFDEDSVHRVLESVRKIEIDHDVKMSTSFFGDDSMFGFLDWNSPNNIENGIKFFVLQLAIGALGTLTGFTETARVIGSVLSTYSMTKCLFGGRYTALASFIAHDIGYFVSMFSDNYVVNTIVDIFGEVSDIVRPQAIGDSIAGMFGSFLYFVFARQIDLSTITLEEFVDKMPAFERKHKSGVYCFTMLLDYLKSILATLLGSTGIGPLDDFIHGDRRLADMRAKVNELLNDELFARDPIRHIDTTQTLYKELCGLEIEYMEKKPQLLQFIKTIRQSLDSFLAIHAASQRHTVEPPTTVFLTGPAGIGKTVLRHNINIMCALLSSSPENIDSVILDPMQKIATFQPDSKFSGDNYKSSHTVLTMDEVQTTAVNKADPAPSFTLLFNILSGTLVYLDGVGVESKNKVITPRFVTIGSNIYGGFFTNYSKQGIYPDAVHRRFNEATVFCYVAAAYATEDTAENGPLERKLDKSKVEFSLDGCNFDHLRFSLGDVSTCVFHGREMTYDDLLDYIVVRDNERKVRMATRSVGAMNEARKFATRLGMKVEERPEDVFVAQGVPVDIAKEMVDEEIDPSVLEGDGLFVNAMRRSLRKAQSVVSTAYDSVASFVTGNKHVLMGIGAFISVAALAFTAIKAFIPPSMLPQSDTANLLRLQKAKVAAHKSISLVKATENPIPISALPVEVPVAQSYISPNTMTYASQRWNKNIGYIFITIPSASGTVKVTRAGSVIAIKGNIFVTPAHVMGALHRALKVGGTVNVHFGQDKYSKAITLADLERGDEVTYYHGTENDQSADVVFFRMSNVTPYADITNHFISHRELISATDWPAIIVLTRNENGPPQPVLVQTRARSAGAISYDLDDGSTMSNMITLQCPINTQNGDCGSMYIGDVRVGSAVQTKILGMHVAGANCLAIGVPITKETIERVMKAFGPCVHTVSNVVLGQSGVIFDADSKDPNVVGAVDLPSIVHSNNMNPSKFIEVGKMVGEHFNKEQGLPIDDYGVRLAGSKTCYHAVSARLNHMPTVNMMRLDYAKAVLRKEMVDAAAHNPELTTPRVVPITEAPNFDIHKAGSLGLRSKYGQKLFGHPDNLKKTDFIGLSGTDPTEAPYWDVLEQQVKLTYKEYASGVYNKRNPANWFSTFPKTEQSPLDPVTGLPKEARTIFNPDIVASTICAMLFGEAAEFAIGTGVTVSTPNPYVAGIGFAAKLPKNCIIRFFRELGAVDADFKGWDKTLHAIFIRAAAELLASFVKFTDEEKRVVDTVITMLQFPTIVVNYHKSDLTGVFSFDDDDMSQIEYDPKCGHLLAIMECVAGQTSGNRLTSVLNSTANKLLQYYMLSCNNEGVWCNHLAPLTINEWNPLDYVTVHVHGDDVLILGKKDDLEKYGITYTNCAVVATELGFQPQPAAKDGRIIDVKDFIWDRDSDPTGQFRAIFLQRYFTERGGNIICPLHPKSIIKQLYYETASFDKLSDHDKTSRWSQFFVELSLHGREIFDKFAPLITKILGEDGIAPVIGDSYDFSDLARASLAKYA